MGHYGSPGICRMSPQKCALAFFILGLFGAFSLWGGIFPDPLQADTLTVTTTADSGAGSLRQAIIDANANPGPDTITFDIAGDGPHTITLLSALPSLTDDGTTIDGYTQSGAVEGSLGPAGTRVLMIEISGDGIAGCGFYITSAGNTIRGLAITGFDECIDIDGEDAYGNVIEGNYLGTDPTGMVGDGPQYTAVVLKNGAHDNLIGGSGLGGGNAGNLISASGQSGSGAGVFIGSGAYDNYVQGNYIGTNAAGTAVISGRTDGVILDGSTTYGNIIGGEDADEGNLIAGFSDNGIKIQTGAYGNMVWGNWVGINATGTAALPNGSGVIVQTGAHDNVIGGSTSGQRNIISGNTGWGVVMVWSSGSYTQSNVIKGNYIGTNPAGDAAIGNGSYGIYVSGCPYTVIGGTASGEGNIVSGNGGDGIGIGGSPGGVTLYGNWIGLNAAGTGSLPNASVGLTIGSDGNTIGGSISGARNVISGNGRDGVSMSGEGNLFMGNYVGVDPTGMAAIGNAFDGVALHSADGNTIGGTGPGEGNVISGNGGRGLQIDGSTGNYIRGNIIGLNAAGNAAVPNDGQGIILIGGSQANVVGGTAAAAANVISGNNSSGILLQDDNTEGNEILGNYIGTDSGDALSLPNVGHGITISSGAHNNRIGCSGGGNRIRHNTQNGISVSGADGTIIEYNVISDSRYGVYLSSADSGTVSYNTISGNASETIESHSYTYTVFAYDADGAGPGEPSPYRSDDQLGNPCTAGAGGEALFYGRNTFDEWVIVCPSSYVDNPVILADAVAAGGFDLSLLSIGGVGEDNQYQIFWVKDNWADRATLEAALGGMATVEAFVPDAILYDSGSGAFYWNPNWEAGVETADAGATVSLYTGFDDYPTITLVGTSYLGGIYLVDSSSNVIESNTISGNGCGVFIASGTGNAITANAIYSNASLGIDLGGDGVTANDSDDSDTGGNNLQNFPVLSSVLTGAGRTMVSGALVSTPDRTFTLEFFSNTAADSSGYGEGETFLGSITALTGGTGTVAFTAVFSGTLPATAWVTATATDMTTDDTSEFSAARAVTVDTTAPTVTVDVLTTNDSTPPLTGTVDDPSATIVVAVNSATYAAVNNGDGTWILTDGTVASLDEGTYDIAVTATDTIGNVGTDATADELTVDITTPRISVNRLVTSDPRPPLSGTVDDPSAVVTVIVWGKGYAALNRGNGTWLLPDDTIFPDLPDGTHNVIAMATDAAGNVGTDSTAGELVIDTYVPPGPTPSPSPEEQPPPFETPGGESLIEEPEPTSSPTPSIAPTPAQGEGAPVLTVAKSVSAETVEAGEDLTYVIRYANGGDGPATDVVLMDPVPAGMSFTRASGGGVRGEDGAVRWAVGGLGAGEIGTVELVLRVDAGASDGTLIANAGYTIGCAEAGPVTGPPVVISVLAPVIQIERSVWPEVVTAPGTVTYTLHYANVGHAPARGITLVDSLPEGTLFVGATNGGMVEEGVVRWEIGTLSAGSSGSVQYTIAVPAGWPVGKPIASGPCSVLVGGEVRAADRSAVTIYVAAPSESDEGVSGDGIGPQTGGETPSPGGGSGGSRVWVWAIAGIGALGIGGGVIWGFRRYRALR